MHTIVLTPGFCKAELLDLSLAQYYEYQKGNYEHWILINGYPIHKETNNQRLRDIAAKYKCKTIECNDSSLHGACNILMNHLNWPDGGIICFDADSAIEYMSHGFDVALSETLEESRNAIGVLALWGIGIDLQHRKRKHEFKKVFIKNNSVLIHPSVEMWSVAIMDIAFMKSIGGFSQVNNYYGGAEIAIHRGFIEQHKCLAYLTEYKERYFAYEGIVDQEYKDYKVAHLAGFTESFEKWLEINKPELLK